MVSAVAIGAQQITTQRAAPLLQLQVLRGQRQDHQGQDCPVERRTAGESTTRLLMPTMGVRIQMAITSEGLPVMKEVTNLLLEKPGQVAEPGLMAVVLKRSLV